jgi:recombination protein RecT
MAQSIIPQKKQKFSVAIRSDVMQNLIKQTLGDDKRATNFIANVSTAVASNPELQTCDVSSVVSAGLVAETLGLSLNQSLGRAYLVPFKIKSKDGTENKVAQFQIGFKGYVELAIRSGVYRDLDVIEVKEGEFLGRDSKTGKLRFSFIEDEDEREKLETIGYLSYFEYINGFFKQMYWTKSKMQEHAKRYSKAYAYDLSKGTSYSFWSINFNDMALKTMLRQIISKWGIMSTEIKMAFEKDQAVIDKNESIFVDNPTSDVEEIVEQQEKVEQVKQKIEQPKDTKNIDDLFLG